MDRPSRLEYVRCEIDGPSARITIDRPEQRNALNNEVIAQLRAAVATATQAPQVRCIVLTGSDGAAFCSGGDLAEMGETAEALDEHLGRGQLAALFTDLWSAGKPTIARVDGYCLAGGFGLALACDIVVASESATFGTPEVKVGLWPYMISLPMLRSMPPKLALRLMMTGEIVSAQQAAAWGFVNDVVRGEDLDVRVAEYTQAFTDVSPQAIKLGRTSFYQVVDHEPYSRFALLHAGLGIALGTSDATEGIRAFREKRAPAWSTGAGDA